MPRILGGMQTLTRTPDYTTGSDRDAARAVLLAPDTDLPGILMEAFRARRRRWGRTVTVHRLHNAQSGGCGEDCSFCSQSSRAVAAGSGTEVYPVQSADQLVAAAERAHADGASVYCMVTATRGPSSQHLDEICEATRRIKAELPIRVCASLGLLGPEHAECLAAAGVDRFNHNLETARSRFGEVCTTHTWEDRAATVRAAKAAGMEACCGGILGLGESIEERLDLAFELRELGVDSLPLNLLDARQGTDLEGGQGIRPTDALKGLAMFRMVHPDVDLRVAGGREKTLGPLQALALYPANSMFTEGYLTTPGQGTDADRALIEGAGFVWADGGSTQ